MVLKNFKSPKLTIAEQVYTLLVSFFIGLLLLTNVITSKYVQVSGFVFTAGAMTYPLMLMVFNLITEIYGKNKAKVAIALGFLASILMMGMLACCHHLTIHEYSPFSQQAFEAIVGFTPGVVVGSLLAYLTSQLLDVYVFSSLKRLTAGKYLWLRTHVSALLSQLVDTIMFATVAWIVFPFLDSTRALHSIAWHTLYVIIRNEYLLKILFNIMSIPIVYASVYRIKRYITNG